MLQSAAHRADGCARAPDPEPDREVAAMAKGTGIDPAIQEYAALRRTADDPLLEELRTETASRLGDLSRMQIGAEQGTLLRMLVTLIGARRAVEIGTFTGYSAIEIARGLAPGGRLFAFDISEEWTGIARKYWERAGVADRIELTLGPASATLARLGEEPIDFAFVDADKAGYAVYYEELLRRLHPNGLLVFDNVLWGGAVIDASNQSEDTRAIRDLNDRVSADPRVECVLLTVADGLLLARKRA
jgi:caffeoyl-CoA O-methyltransferase